MSTTEATRRPQAVTRPADKIFKGTAVFAGVGILTTLALVAAFLLYQAIPSLTASNAELIDGHVLPNGVKSLFGFVYPLLFGTLLSSIIALVIAAPLSIGIALFISHYAPRSLAQGLGYLIDLLAAVPSIIFGLWGLSVVGTQLQPVEQWLAENASFLFFVGDGTGGQRSMLVVGIVLAIMILPIMTAVNREVFLQTPRLHEEASLALGATRWEMIRQAVLPFGRSGIISGAMLGLGRALGETMAIAIILSISVFDKIQWVVTDGANNGTIAGKIALDFPEATGELNRSTLILTGLVLFIVTLLVNMAARWVVSRRAEFSGAN